MRGALALCLLATSLGASGAGAQTPGQPRLFLSLFTGYRLGARLWSLNGQPLPVFVANGDTAVATNPSQYDTLDLQRRIAPGFVVGTAGAYFPSPALGFEAEIAFLGMTLDTQCSIHQFQPADPNDLDPELCSSVTDQSITMGAVNVAVGVVGRVNAGGSTTPYARFDVGLLSRSRGTIAVTSHFTNGTQGSVETTILDDPNPNTTNWQFTVGTGVAFALGNGYQLRFEGRDVMSRLHEVTGIAVHNPNGAASFVPPQAARFYHNLAFVIGLDVIFEKRRGRRY